MALTILPRESAKILEKQSQRQHASNTKKLLIRSPVNVDKVIEFSKHWDSVMFQTSNHDQDKENDSSGSNKSSKTSLARSMTVEYPSQNTKNGSSFQQPPLSTLKRSKTMHSAASSNSNHNHYHHGKHHRSRLINKQKALSRLAAGLSRSKTISCSGDISCHQTSPVGNKNNRNNYSTFRKHITLDDIISTLSVDIDASLDTDSITNSDIQSSKSNVSFADEIGQSLHTIQVLDKWQNEKKSNKKNKPLKKCLAKSNTIVGSHFSMPAAIECNYNDINNNNDICILNNTEINNDEPHKIQSIRPISNRNIMKNNVKKVIISPNVANVETMDYFDQNDQIVDKFVIVSNAQIQAEDNQLCCQIQ